MVSVNIAGRAVGPSEDCRFIAATGSAHNGSLDQAYNLIDAAVGAGADAIMFQAYTGALYHDEARVVRQLVAEGRIEDRPKAFAKYMESRAMQEDWHPKLWAHCHRKGIGYLPAVFGDDDLRILVGYHRREKVMLAGLGIESMDHQAPTFVTQVASVAADFRIPVVMSTGVREGDSVDSAVNALREVRATFALVHSVFGSPSAPDEQGLSEIGRLQGRFNVPVGYSNHTIGHPDADDAEIVSAAVHSGAHLIKAQLCLPQAAAKAPGGPRRAWYPDEFRDMVQVARQAQAESRERRRIPPTRIFLYSGPADRPRPSEQPWRDIERVIVATTHIAVGEELVAGTRETAGNVTSRRGGVGLPARSFQPGMVARVALAADRPIRLDEVDLSNPGASAAQRNRTVGKEDRGMRR